MNRYALAVCVGLVIVCNSGCGKPARRVAPPLRSVKGTVNLDGKPMADGEIWFDRYGEPVKIFQIKNGIYAGEAHEGENRVEIRAFKDAPGVGSIKGEPITLKMNIIPAEFNTESDLKADVTASGANDFKFDITR
jgi:hypothetical protein